jgi:hypothetical protein
MLITNDDLKDTYRAREKARLKKEIAKAADEIAYYEPLEKINELTQIKTGKANPFTPKKEKAKTIKESAEKRLKDRQLEAVRAFKKKMGQ